MGQSSNIISELMNEYIYLYSRIQAHIVFLFSYTVHDTVQSMNVID